MVTAGPITCARCGKLSPPRTRVCGCGFRFGAGAQRALVGERARAREGAWWTAAFGGGMVVIGLILTLASLSSPNRGTSYIFYGVIVAGCIWLTRGLSRLRTIDALPPLATDEPSLDEEGD